MLEHFGQLLQRLAPVAVQRDAALVRLLAGELVFRVERDRAAPAAVHIEQRLQPRTFGDFAHHLGGRAKGEIAAHLGHRELDRTVAHHLQHEVAVEADARLHQHGRRGHLAEQLAHRQRERFARNAATLQHLLPCAAQAQQRAAHRQPFEDESVQLAGAARRRFEAIRHRIHSIRFKPLRKRFAFST